MLSLPDKIKIITILDGLMGPGINLKQDERVHYCPFCHHPKRKMNVNIATQQYHCWVCNNRGKTLYSLLKKLKASKLVINKINNIYSSDYKSVVTDFAAKSTIELPKEFKSLTVVPNGIDPLYKNTIYYLKSRNILIADIIKYNIGYCKSGRYSGRVIIPSYDVNGMLNYFIARTIFEDDPYPYKNPPVSKNIVAFENQINWKYPITICEGIFDAMAIKRNAIPIFGKVIPNALMVAIFKNSVSEINIMLDADAQSQALYYTNYFKNQGIYTKNIIPYDKDASDMGFSKITPLIKNTTEANYSDIISQKLKTI